jgi:hypothetical protein
MTTKTCEDIQRDLRLLRRELDECDRIVHRAEPEDVVRGLRLRLEGIAIDAAALAEEVAA